MCGPKETGPITICKLIQLYTYYLHLLYMSHKDTIRDNPDKKSGDGDGGGSDVAVIVGAVAAAVVIAAAVVVAVVIFYRRRSVKG